jgi:hypothetical protein
MNIPGREPSRGDLPLTPARRNRDRGRSEGTADVRPEYDDADLQRGLAAAVLGTLGRMQLRLEALSHQQMEAFSALQSTLAALDARLAALEPPAPPVAPLSPPEPMAAREDLPPSAGPLAPAPGSFAPAPEPSAPAPEPGWGVRHGG